MALQYFYILCAVKEDGFLKAAMVVSVRLSGDVFFKSGNGRRYLGLL